jgi:hypothetical protein
VALQPVLGVPGLVPPPLPELRGVLQMQRGRGRRLAVPVLVPSTAGPVLHAERRVVPVRPVGFCRRRLPLLAAVPVQDVVVAGLAALVRVVVPPVGMVVVAVVVRVPPVVVVVVMMMAAFPVPRARAVVLVRLRPKQVVHRVEEAVLMQKPQDYCACTNQHMGKNLFSEQMANVTGSSTARRRNGENRAYLWVS